MTQQIFSHSGGGSPTLLHPAWSWRRLPHSMALHWVLSSLLASFALVGALMADGACHPALRAQGTGPGSAQAFRLQVRPHKMVLGTRNAKAGMQMLDTLGDSIYIPPKAVGTRRMPLVITFSTDSMERWRQMADHYGVIFLRFVHYTWDDEGVKNVSDVLQQVLSTYAIDPDKIAPIGMSNSGWAWADIGCANLDIFSRMALLSPIPGRFRSCADTTRPLMARTQMFLAVGTGEPNGIQASVLAMAAQARRDGHPMQLVLNLRPHQSRLKDHGNAWQWFVDSWASPKATARPASRGGAVIPLTTDAITKMTTFWKDFRRDHLLNWEDVWPTVNEKAVTIFVGRERMTVYDMVDIKSIAAKETSVAVALKKAGLTFAQEEGYRAALFGARTTMLISNQDSTFMTTPAVEQNVKFLRESAHSVNNLLDIMGIIRCVTSGQEEVQPGSCGRD